jgi:hypothetical protein
MDADPLSPSEPLFKYLGWMKINKKELNITNIFSLLNVLNKRLHHT